MEWNYKNEDKLLTITLKEEIDHHTVEKIRRKIDNEIQRYMPKKVVFDFNYVNFMDSAGIGLLIGRYKITNMLRRNFRNKEYNYKCKKNIGDVRCAKNYTNSKREDCGKSRRK